MSEVVSREKQVWSCSRCHAIYRKDFPFCPADGGEVVVTESDPLVGEELGQYVVETLLGEGAMGRVYRAHHRHLADRVYAVKVLLGDLATTQEARMRFLNEARSASKLSHPNVVTVYDVGRTEGGVLYLAMELVVGTSLADMIAKGPMQPEMVASLVRGIADGLAHAHAHGIVHRDLKPENVIVVRGPDGELMPRIVDFGIAVSIEQEDARLTATGMAIGTPGYVAPEQVAGQRVGPSADQYALGATMFEMLTGGVLPFTGTAMEVATAKTSREAPLVSSCVPQGTSVPPAMEDIVARMIARKAAQRFDSIADVSRMLARWTNAPETEVIAAPPRGHLRAIFAASAVVLLGGAVLAWTQLRDRRAPDAAPARVATNREAAVAPPAPPVVTPTATREPTSPPPTADSHPADDAGANAPGGDPTDDPADADEPPEPNASAKKPSRPHRVGSTKKKSTPTAVKKTTPLEVATVVPPPLPPPPPEKVAPPPAPRAPISGRLARVVVSGGISQTDVRRAIARIQPAISRCTAAAEGTAQLRFTIDDARRPSGLRGSGVANPTLACLIAAFGAARVEVAPDVGDAEVQVDIQFSGST